MLLVNFGNSVENECKRFRQAEVQQQQQKQQLNSNGPYDRIKMVENSVSVCLLQSSAAAAAAAFSAFTVLKSSANTDRQTHKMRERENGKSHLCAGYWLACLKV